MSTTLAEQLKKLALPQTNILQPSKKKASLLFDPKEAASLDRTTIYEIGYGGFEELKNIDHKFHVFDSTLFSKTSCSLERAVQSAEVNRNLNENIKKFLILLSPHYLMKPAQQALEWLINRFQIHEYNKDDLFALILPYHETGMFVRCLQIMNVKDSRDKWHWLYSIQKAGAPLAKSVLINHCTSNIAFLKFISNMVIDKTKTFDDNSNLLVVDYAFYCTTLMGTLHSRDVSEQQIMQLLPSILKGLSSQILDFASSAYMIAGQLLLKTKLKKKLLIKFLTKLASAPRMELRVNATMLMVLLFQTHISEIEAVPKHILMELISNEWFISSLKSIAFSGVRVTTLVIAIFSTVFEVVQQFNEETDEVRKFAELLFQTVNLDDQSAAILIKLAFTSFNGVSQNNFVTTEEDVQKETARRLWYCSFVQMLNSKYSDAFDKTSSTLEGQQKVNFNIISKLPSYRQKSYRIFDRLSHYDWKTRGSVVQELVETFSKLPDEDKEFLKDPLFDRLKDDHPLVVIEFLKFPIETLLDIFDSEALVNGLLDVLFKCQNKTNWHSVTRAVLHILCSNLLQISDITLLLAIMPFIFPFDTEETIIGISILKSKFGEKCKLLKGAKDELELIDLKTIKSSEDFCTQILDIISKGTHLQIDELLACINSYPVHRQNVLHKYLSLLLLNVTMSTGCPPEIGKLVFEFVMQCYSSTKKLQVPENLKFSDDLKSFRTVETEQLMLARNGNLSLVTILNSLLNIINNTEIISEGFFDFLQPNSLVLLFIHVNNFLLTGSSSENDDIKNAYNDVIGSFLNKLVAADVDPFQYMCHFYFVKEISDFSCYPLKLDVSKDLQLQVMNLLHTYIAEEPKRAGYTIDFDKSLLIPTLLISLISPSPDVRLVGVSIFELFAERSISLGSYQYILKPLLKRKSGILMDPEQLPLILYTLISPDKSVQKNIRTKKDKLQALTVLENLVTLSCDEKCPGYLATSLLKLLSMMNSKEILLKCSELVLRIIQKSGDSESLGSYDSAICLNILSKVNVETLRDLKEDSNIWILIESILTRFSMQLMNEVGKSEYVSVYLFKVFEKNVFDVLPECLQRKFLKLLINVRTESLSSENSMEISRIIKRVDLDLNLLNEYLVAMANAKSAREELNEKRRRRASIAPSMDIFDTSEWKNGITVLEFIQNKKKLINMTATLPILFDILKKCLDFEEQAPLEYTKQLVLSCILNCCQRLVADKPITRDSIPEGMLNIELVVHCIRASQNPQTHHHVLMLLSYTAALVPKQVLHHIMAIFTFMGSCVLRHDDAYSFQIIAKIIDNVIPILINSDLLGDALTDDDADALVGRIIPIVRVFVDVLLDVPVHRRNPLYQKLMNTLGSKYFLWVFVILTFETYVSRTSDKNVSTSDTALPNVHEAPQLLDFVRSFMCLFTPDVVLHTSIKMIEYLKTLPKEKIEKSQSGPFADLFDIDGHTPKKFRHFKYTILTFISSVLSLPEFVRSISVLSTESNEQLEIYYKKMIINILAYIQIVSKYADQSSGSPQGKYWKVMLHHCYDLLDNVNSLLCSEMFLLVIRGLMAHNLPTVRRKAMELFNSRLQRQDDFLNQIVNDNFFTMLDLLLEVISSGSENDDMVEIEDELNQQTALLSIKLISKHLAHDYPDKFRPILDKIITLIKQDKSGNNVLASLLLCLAELCSSLRVHSLYSLPNFMPVLMKILRAQKQKETPDLLLLSLVTTIHKVVDVLPQFLSPYLEKLLIGIAILNAKWIDQQENQKFAPVLMKLKAITNKISTSVPHRVLIPVIGQCYQNVLNSNRIIAVGGLMDVLSECIGHLNKGNLKPALIDLTGFFLTALEFRSNYAEENKISFREITTIEGHIVRALVVFVLKLSESSFRPLYFKFFDWASRNTEQKERAITFYRLSCDIAQSLKGLFVLFAGSFLNHAANLLDECNTIKTESLLFSDNKKCVSLIEYIIQTLRMVCEHDSQKFINKERFELLMQPIVDQLENIIDDLEVFQKRTKMLVIPCIAHFAVAVADDSLWKQLNYQILLKTRHNLPAVRLAGLEAVCQMAQKLGEDFLPMLPETIPFLAELLEDEDETVELACRKAVQGLEKVLGESLQKYF